MNKNHPANKSSRIICHKIASSTCLDLGRLTEYPMPRHYRTQVEKFADNYEPNLKEESKSSVYLKKTSKNQLSENKTQSRLMYSSTTLTTDDIKELIKENRIELDEKVVKFPHNYLIKQWRPEAISCGRTLIKLYSNIKESIDQNNTAKSSERLREILKPDLNKRLKVLKLINEPYKKLLMNSITNKLSSNEICKNSKTIFSDNKGSTKHTKTSFQNIKRKEGCKNLLVFNTKNKMKLKGPTKKNSSIKLKLTKNNELNLAKTELGNYFSGHPITIRHFYK